MKTALNKPYIQNPDRWDIYENALDNLLYAVLLRGVNDCLGYYDSNSGKFDNGKDAVKWVKTEGYKIFKHLLTAPKKPKDVLYEVNNMRHRQLSFDEITKIYIERINGNENNK